MVYLGQTFFEEVAREEKGGVGQAGQQICLDTMECTILLPCETLHLQQTNFGFL